ncbi:MAG TPA: hypothetical protein VGO93_32030 [Candidatus Xenobia bacterium]|jgi:hypothetical protein
MTLRRNPFYARSICASAQRRQPGPGRLLGAGVLFVGVVWLVMGMALHGAGEPVGVVETLGPTWFIAALVLAARLILSGVVRGHNVVAEEHQGRRFEVLECAPLTPADYVDGFLASALRPTLVEGLCWGVLLLGVASLLPELLPYAFALVPYILGASLLATVVGLWMAGREMGARLVVALFLLGALGVGTLMVGWFYPGAEVMFAANPMIFWEAVNEHGYSLGWEAMLGIGAFGEFALCALALTGFMRRAWTPWVEPPVQSATCAPAPVSHQVVRYAKAEWCRNPYLSVAVVRYRRGSVAIGSVAVAALLGHTWSSCTSTDLGSQAAAGLIAMLLIGLGGFCSANNLVAREREPRRLDLLLATGLSIPALMYGQWLASLVPLTLPALVFALFSGSIIPALAAILGLAAGSAVGMLISYRIRFAPWVWLLLGVLGLCLLYRVACFFIPTMRCTTERPVLTTPVSSTAAEIP